MTYLSKKKEASQLTSVKVGHNLWRAGPIIEGEVRAPDEQLRKGGPHFARLTFQQVLGDARRRAEEEELSKLLAHAGTELHQVQQRIVPVRGRTTQRLLGAPADGEEEARHQFEQLDHERFELVVLENETREGMTERFEQIRKNMTDA